MNSIDILLIPQALSVTDHLKTDLKGKLNEQEQESIHIQTEDKQVQPIHNRSKSSIPRDQHSTNVHETITDSQNTLDERDIIKFEEEHAVSTILPDQDISTFDEPFQLVQTKILDKKSRISSKKISNSEDQILPFHHEKNNDNIRKGSSNLEHDSSDTSEKSSSATNLHTNYLDQDNQSLYSVNNGELQSMITPTSSHSDTDLSQQSDQLQPHENIKPSEQLVIDGSSKSEDQYETPQKQFDSNNDENNSPGFGSEHMKVSIPNSISILIKNIGLFSFFFIIKDTKN